MTSPRRFNRFLQTVNCEFCSESTDLSRVCFRLREVTPSSKEVSKSLTRLRPRFFSPVCSTHALRRFAPAFISVLSGELATVSRGLLRNETSLPPSPLCKTLREQCCLPFDTVQHRIAFADQRQPVATHLLHRPDGNITTIFVDHVEQPDTATVL